jgi:biopolymer transport protein ExbD
MPQPYGIAGVIGVLVVVMVVAIWREEPKGILARITSRDLKAFSVDPRLKPPVLRIDAKGQWFLDGDAVTPEGFPAALRKSFSRRLDRFVYLEADPNLDFRVPARAMDMIQGLHAKVILLMPSARPRPTP